MAEQKRPDGETRKHIEVMHTAGLSVREIARALDLSTQAVYWHLHRIDEEATR